MRRVRPAQHCAAACVAGGNDRETMCQDSCGVLRRKGGARFSALSGRRGGGRPRIIALGLHGAAIGTGNRQYADLLLPEAEAPERAFVCSSHH